MKKIHKEWWFFFSLREKSPSDYFEEHGFYERIEDTYEAAYLRMNAYKKVTPL